MPALPLEGIRVLDASNTYAGPTCGRVLADLGAQVIHVEAMQRMELVRLIVLPENRATETYWNTGAYFMKRNLGKQDITLDLTRPQGVELFKAVAAKCDVVLESFAPRVMRNFGLDYEQIRAVRPDVVYCSLSGYGQDGPYRDWVAYGMGLEPASGISQLTGYAGEGPMRSGISLTDPLSGLAAAVAVLVALHHRRRTGEGQYIDLSEHEAAIPLVAGALLDRQMNGREPERRGNRSWFAAPQGVYPCAGTRHEAPGNSERPAPIPHSADPPRRAGIRIPHSDEWLAISCHTDAEFAALCDAVGHPEWKEDERFADLLARHANHDALDELIAGWTRGLDKIAATERLQRAGVRAAAVVHAKDLLLNPHLRERGHFVTVRHPDVGRRLFPRQLPVHFSKFDAMPSGPAPRLGEHNDEVLTALAGLSAEDLARLREEKIIGDRPEPLPPVELIRDVAQWPVDVLMEVGAIKQIDADYRAQLAAFGYHLHPDSEPQG